MKSWFPKGAKTAVATARRITGISTLFGGVQLAPRAPDTSFGRARDERQLLDEIWLLALSEAYGAKDAARRLEEMTGRSRLDVIELYFGANPELRSDGWIATSRRARVRPGGQDRGRIPFFGPDSNRGDPNQGADRG